MFIDNAFLCCCMQEKLLWGCTLWCFRKESTEILQALQTTKCTIYAPVNMFFKSLQRTLSLNEMRYCSYPFHRCKNELDFIFSLNFKKIMISVTPFSWVCGWCNG